LRGTGRVEAPSFHVGSYDTVLCNCYCRFPALLAFHHEFRQLVPLEQRRANYWGYFRSDSGSDSKKQVRQHKPPHAKPKEMVPIPGLFGTIPLGDGQGKC